MTGPYVLFQLPAESDTVHDRHHNIADYDIRDAAKSLLLSFFSIVGGEYFERICEGLGDIFLYLFIVFYNQQDRFGYPVWFLVDIQGLLPDSYPLESVL